MQQLDFQEVARNTAQVDRALSQATSIVEGFLHRGFFPYRGTRYFDWPNIDYPVSWRLWLDDNELASLTSITAGGISLTPANVIPYPRTGPPYSYLETSLAANDVYQAGSSWQNAIAITGLWCGTNGATQTVGTLNGTINSSVTTLALSDSSQVGVGDVLLIESEYVVVTGLTQATTGQTLQTPLTASAAGTSVAVTTGSSFAIGETITLDAEQMLVVDITGNTLIVKRAFNGSVLAAHTGSTIYAPRSFTVTRGQCGSTATAHTSGVSVGLHIIPGAVQALTFAEAGWLYAGHAAGWQLSNNTTRNVPSETALAVIKDLREEARRVAGRKLRQRAV